MSRARQVANFDPALFAADEVSGDKVSGGTIGAGTIGGTSIINTSGAITTTGAFTSVGIDDNASGAVAITIDSSENVGIGTNAPTNALDVAGDIGLLGADADTSSSLRFYDTGGLEWTAQYDAGSLKFSESGVATRVTFEDGGHVGIGTSSPAYDLHASNSSANCFFGVESSGSNQTIIKLISGATRLNTDATRLIFDCGSTNCAIIQVDQGGTQNTAGLSFWTANGAASSQKLKINADGTFVGSGSANISDERLKENITPITNGLASINALSGKTFTWKTKADMQTGIQYGLIAQEVESVLPDLILDNCSLRKIDTATDEIADDAAQTGVNGIEYAKNVKVTAVIPILVEAVKELSAKVTALENA